MESIDSGNIAAPGFSAMLWLADASGLILRVSPICSWLIADRAVDTCLVGWISCAAA